ncbi:MAG: hypothetical protein GC134_06005 [Proteobacteria bacterium]|nr:hypothetical protein [Pseudomonadota bacterium]
MKFQIVLVALIVGGIFLFRDQINAYLGLDSGHPVTTADGTLPESGLIKSNGTALYSSRNGNSFGTASAGDRVHILAGDSAWLQIHHNGLTAWVRANDIDLSQSDQQN